MLRAMLPMGFFCLMCLTISVWTTVALADESPRQSLEFAGQWPYHPGKGLAMDPDRDLLFLGDGDRLDILDTDFNRLSSMNVTQSGLISGLFYSTTDQMLYIACKNDGLRMVDVSDTANPFEAGAFFPEQSNTEINGVFVKKNLAYLAAGIDGLIIINITDTASPEVVSQLSLPGGFAIPYAVDIVATGNFAYVADILSGIHGVDVTDPVNPAYAGIIALAGAHDMALSDNYLYTTLEGSGMAITDISLPTAPTVDSVYYADNGLETSVRVVDNLAYIGYAAEGLRIIDTTDPAKPIHIPAWIYTDSGSTSIGLIPGATSLYTTNDQVGLEKIDISDKTAMQSVLSYDTPADAVAVDVSNGFAFIVDDNSGITPKREGLRIIALSSYLGVVQLYLKGFCPTPGKALDVMVDGSYAFVADGEMGLQIIDIADKTMPTIIGTCDTPDLASGIFVTGNYAFVADGEMGLAVINITDKTAPFITGSVDTPGVAKNVVVAGMTAFIADGEAGLQVINIDNKTKPFIQGACDTPGIASGIFVTGNYVFVADGDMGMAVIDITDKSAPFLIISIDTPGFAGNISVIGDYAYIADGEEGVSAINVTIPFQPVKYDNLSYNSNGFTSDISIAYTSEDEALFTFIADGAAGLIALNIAPENAETTDNPGNSSGGCFVQTVK